MSDASAPSSSIAGRLLVAPVNGLTRLCRSSSKRTDHRNGARAGRWLLVAILAGGAIALSMLVADVPAILAQLPRGAPELWWVRIFTEFAQSEYWLFPLAVATLALLIAGAVANRPVTRGVIAALTVRVAFLFLAIGVPNLVSQILKGVIGRGRPFVGGKADAFVYSPMSFEARFESIPSGHAVTAFAAAFAIAALWPRTRVPLAIFAVLIAVSRVVLLAHHPSDVMAGAALGLIGAMMVRYWFAARRLGFYIASDGAVRPMAGPSFQRLKKVARGLFSQ